MRRTLPVLMILGLMVLDLATRMAAAEARVVPAPETERGGEAIPRGKAGPDCVGAAGFGWFPALDAEAVARWTAAGRAELAAGRPAWRSPRLIGRPARRPLLLRPLGPILPRLR